ncbi:Molybdopterin or thiamine biosynthesis adenylyltransferase [Lentibacillus persicus]|uniref:Molybdopterin or thiamine biosynthesis adenylyltransferase n=1 Tax=Lentibacillus persicus TaxID=640948 RepID=A0A1I1YXM3_9BACI|nr:thiazole biosynthesis adenylyltransferase ThiF [Lentibacillus persicus]SFE24316.1 Molybdopterin or thiamine biosynthesis adenylyltransferase [Lentibacillus persicus]
MEERYSRQILFSPIGSEGQRHLRRKHVLIIGAGALGTSIAEMLTRAGTGKITIADRDYVEWSNLQRQQLYTEEDAINRMPKAIVAKRKLQAINRDVVLEAEVTDVTPEKMEQLVDGVDLMLDATDNFDIRMIMNDTAQKFNIPWIYGAIVSSYGISYTIIPNETPCLHCLMEQVPIGGLTCDTAGVISPIVQLVTAHQTAEALKILTENRDALRNTLVSFDIWTNNQSSIKVDPLKSDNCSSCGKSPSYPFLNYENQTKTAVLCGRDTVQIRPETTEKPDLPKVADQLAQVGTVEQNPFLLSVAIDSNRLVLFQDGRVLVHGTNDTAQAKSLYHRYIG